MKLVLDGAGEGSAKACWVLIRGARADMFRSASHGESFQLHQKLLSSQPKKPDRYWSAPAPHPAAREPQRFQSLTLAMSGGLNLAAVMAAVDADFVDEVTRDLRPGMTAVIVEANEGSTRPIDDIVALGGRRVLQ